MNVPVVQKKSAKLQKKNAFALFKKIPRLKVPICHALKSKISTQIHRQNRTNLTLHRFLF